MIKVHSEVIFVVDWGMQPTTGYVRWRGERPRHAVNTGSLVVFVLDTGGALPIPGALVKILQRR